jgi:AAA domain (dynein-related subfamily)
MATWTGYKTTPVVLTQAENWKSKCLRENGSVFSDEGLWTVENFAELKTQFVDNPILGGQKFYEKLTLQLEGTRPEVAKLAAESLWLLLMFVGDSYFGAATKTARIQEIWELSGDKLPQTPVLGVEALAGVANPGTAFLTKIPDEYGYLIELLIAWKQMPAEHRTALLDDAPWKLCEWVASNEGSAVRAFRHMLLYFCYPSYFERICSRNHKNELYKSFSEILELDQDFYKNDATPCNLDKTILSIRQKLEKEYGTSKIDFYDKSLRERWGKEDKDAKKRNPGAGEMSPPVGPNIWIEKSIIKGRPDRDSGENRLGEALWSPKRAKNGGDFYANMRLVAPGDIVLHLTDNLGFSGKSRVAEKMDDQFVGLPDTDWSGQPGYRVQLSDFEALVPKLPRDAFFKDAEIGPDMRALLDTKDGHGLFYNRKLELNQGAYLSRAPRSLVTLLNKAYQKTAGRKLVEIPDQDIPLERLEANPMTPKSLNTIFYGPPGTGKTYVTARRAVEICDGLAPVGNDELRERYDQLVKQRRVEFVTFHQTYGYEEFVEGLRPDTGESDDENSGAGFRLQPVDGVLKRIADRARKLPAAQADTFDPSHRKVFKVSLGRSDSPEEEYLRDECLTNGYILLGYGGDIDWSPKKYNSWDAVAERWREEPGEENTTGRHGNIIFTYQIRASMSEGDIILASKGNKKIQAIGVVSGPYEFVRRDADGFHHRRGVNWLWIDQSGDGISVEDVYSKNFMMHPIYYLNPKLINWDALLPYLEEKSETGSPPEHVLIIDEINRANISKVMGELITLLEEDKRAGAPNEIAVTLPHSGQAFTLPSNLHIIGTMNTADRSIALLDTALRRRFQFVEMPPEPGVLKEIDGVDVSSVLQSINSRMEWFLGTDQLIGHAWLMSAKTISELDAIMSNKIIPLLREYFHEDLDRVRAVLGGGDRFLRRERIPTPPGIDDYGEERWKFVDRFKDGSSYGLEAYAEAIVGTEPAKIE